MFDQIPTNDPLAKPPEDIFASVDSQTKNQIMTAPLEVPNQGSKRWLIIGGLVFVLAGAVFAGTYIFNLMKSTDNVAMTENQTPTIPTTPVNPETPIIPSTPVVNPPVIEPTTPVIPEIPITEPTTPIVRCNDQAIFTLTTVTATDLTDSDTDGLTDYEETQVYQTNACVVDTDKDTFLDGAEVCNGYNPNGSGRIAVTFPVKTNCPINN